MQEKSLGQIAYEVYMTSMERSLWLCWDILPLKDSNAWYNVAKALESALGSTVSNPTDDPALELAQRIARIAAETGLKPRMVWSIIDGLRWTEITAAEKAQQAEASQENHAETPG